MNANKIISYIVSSVASVFEISYTPIFLEGEIPDPLTMSTTDNEKEFELRLTEFNFNTFTKNNHGVTFDIDMLVKMRLSLTSPYEIKAVLGQLVSTFSDVFTIKRYGEEVDDDETVIGCLNLLTPIEAVDLGQVDDTVNLVFGRVTANYRLDWSE